MAEAGPWMRLSALVLAGLAAGLTEARADDHAVVLLYHHVGDETPASTSVTPEVFESHLDYLARHHFTVLPLSEVVHALAEHRPLPAGTVALTFDDAYVSVYRQALPRLERRGWPFTVFVSTDSVDQGYAAFMGWDQLRDLEARGGTVGNHTTRHAHLVRREPEESEAAWERRVRDDIARAQARLEGSWIIL